MNTLKLMFRKLIFKESCHEYDDVYTFVFDNPKSLHFEAGQFAHLLVSLIPSWGSWRRLSFASDPEDRDIWFSVHTGSKSAFKQKLLQLKPGGYIWLVGVEGGFMLPDHLDQPVVLLGGGIGVTPFRSILRSARRLRLKADITLIHKAAGDFLYKDEFSKLPYTQYRIGRNELDATLARIVSEKPEALFYVAGSEDVVAGMRKKLIDLGVKTGAIKLDEFTGYTKEA